MTLHVFPDPRADVQALLEAGKAALWPTATISTAFPDAEIDVPHLQHDWDGTPARQSNRETAAIRVTVWAPRGKLSRAIVLAGRVESYLLGASSAATWRVLPGAGRVPGTDPATKLPFCTFSVNAETRPTPLD